jgi:sulfatase modifying factor 1
MSEDADIERLLVEGAIATCWVELPGGCFTMGSDRRADEQPIHEETVGPFAASLLPVTNLEWNAFSSATGHEALPWADDPRFNRPAQPVVGVSWFDAVAYCEWLSELLGRRCRFPTETEREYAARGGVVEVLYPWGDEPWSEGLYAFGAAGTDRPPPVGSSPPNGFGLYHMADGVHEWCSDWYAKDAYAAATVGASGGPSEGMRKTSRGGSWRHRVKVARITARSSLAPERRYNDYGIRVYSDAAGSS